MKKLSTLVGLAFFVLLIVGCEGPQGPAGTNGVDGADGADGADGINAAETCTDCHVDDTEMYAKQVQYAVSKHRTGGNFERGSNVYDDTDNECAVCHSHEGFTEFLATGTTSFTPAFDNPTPPNCRTCHEIHTSYTQADWGLTSTSAVTMYFDGATNDRGSVGNLCINCHQARPTTPMPTVGDPGTIAITSSRYGGHYGWQAQVLGGISLFEFGNTTVAGGPNTHGNTTSNAAVCATCHMAAAFGEKAGGHTWNMHYMYHGSDTDLIAGCETSGCHSTVTDFDVNGVQTTVEACLTHLGSLLETAGIKQAGLDYVETTNSPFTNDLAAAWINYYAIVKDHSHGVHNPAYVLDVLEDTINDLGGTWPCP
jgi:hypothetical protein